MEGTYGVYFGDTLCGKVQVTQKGLYYRFVCRCHLTGDVVCRLQILFRDRQISIGVLVPVDDGFGLTKSVPAKHFSGKPVKFCISTRQESISGFFAPIYPEEPFSYLEQIKKAYLIKKDSQPAALIPITGSR